jgi:hypothetical protein
LKKKKYTNEIECVIIIATKKIKSHTLTRYIINVIASNNVKYRMVFLYKLRKSKLNFIVFINLLENPCNVFNQTIMDVRWYMYKICMWTKDHKFIFILLLFK